MTFYNLGLSEEVLRAVEEAGYKEPTPIQKQAIPVVLQGRDVLGIAQTGTGKTASFTLPMIDVLSSGRARARMPRSLIVEPTRELAAQVAENFEIYGKYQKLTKALLIGGVSFSDQEKLLDRGVDVLIATPGRLLDHFERGKVLLNGVDILVIDEADRMLDMGFIPDIERIMSLITQRHQTLFFSATMPPEIKRLTDRFLNEPKMIEASRPAAAAETVTQLLVMVRGKDAEKRAKLRDLIRSEQLKNAIIFCNRKRDVLVVYKSLQQHGFNAGQLHGDMDQSSRMEALQKFKDGEIQLMVASDVAARGLDIPKVSHVFNFDVPIHADDYIHRIGRTGRAGQSGRAITIATSSDSKFVDAIERLMKTPIPRDTETQEATADVAEKPVARPADAKPRPPKKPADKPADKPAGKPADRPARKTTARRGGRDRQGAEDDNQTAVVGLGDHMPAFLLRSFPDETKKPASAPAKKATARKSSPRKPATRKGSAKNSGEAAGPEAAEG